MTLSLSHWYPGSGAVLDCVDSDICLLSYFNVKILHRLYRRAVKSQMILSIYTVSPETSSVTKAQGNKVQ